MNERLKATTRGWRVSCTLYVVSATTWFKSTSRRVWSSFCRGCRSGSIATPYLPVSLLALPPSLRWPLSSPILTPRYPRSPTLFTFIALRDKTIVSVLWIERFITPPPVGRWGIVFWRFLSFFVSLSATLRENGWTDLHEIFREGVEWPWNDLIKFWVNSGKRVDGSKVNLFVITGHSSEDWR